MDNMKHRRLQELDRSDFGIVDGEPDIRGWDVRTGNGEKVGEVEELIVDAQKKKVRYMVVDLDNNELELDHRKILIPIGLAQLDDDDDDVRIHAISTEQLHNLPTYEADHLDDEVERKISAILGREAYSTGQQAAGHSTPGQDDDFYGHEHFNDNNLYKNRMHEERLAQARREKDSSDQQERHSQQREQEQEWRNGAEQQHTEDKDKARSQEQSPRANQTTQRRDDEYERGLRLWEMRSKGGIIDNNDQQQNSEINETRRREMVQDRRRKYEERRSQRKDNSIAARIDREGLQDAKK